MDLVFLTSPVEAALHLCPSLTPVCSAAGLRAVHRSYKRSALGIVTEFNVMQDITAAASGVRGTYITQRTKRHDQASRALGLMPRARAAVTCAVPDSRVISVDLSPGIAPHTPLPPLG